MYAIVPIAVWLGGIIAASILFKFLRPRIGDTVAYGLSLVVLGLAHYPITSWLFGSQQQQPVTLTTWLVFCALGSIVGTVVYSKLTRRQQ